MFLDACAVMRFCPRKPKRNGFLICPPDSATDKLANWGLKTALGLGRPDKFKCPSTRSRPSLSIFLRSGALKCVISADQGRYAPRLAGGTSVSTGVSRFGGDEDQAGIFNRLRAKAPCAATRYPMDSDRLMKSAISG